MGRAFTVALAAAVLSLPALLALSLFLTPWALLGVPLGVGAAWLLPRRLWPDGSQRAGFGLLALGAGITFVASFVSFLYAYGLSISAGLCGDTGAPGVAAFVPGYLIVGSWALRDRGRILWAWPLAVLAATALAMLVVYATPSAHGLCET